MKFWNFLFSFCGLQLLDVKFHIELLEDEEMIEAWLVFRAKLT